MNRTPCAFCTWYYMEYVTTRLMPTQTAREQFGKRSYILV